MLTEKHFKQMKKSCDLHQHRPRPDRGRGSADQGACRKNGSPGAALDVLEKEPPSHNNPLLHVEERDAVAAQRLGLGAVRARAASAASAELSLVLGGFWPMSCVNPQVLQATKLKRWQPIGMGRGPNS